MVSQVVEERIAKILARAFDGSGSEEERLRVYSECLRVCGIINNRVAEGKRVSLAPIKQDIIEGVFAFTLDKELILRTIDKIVQSLIRGLDEEGFGRDEPQTLQYIRYAELIKDSVREYALFSENETIDYLSELEAYKPSSPTSILSNVDRGSRLFKGNRGNAVAAPSTRLGGTFLGRFKDTLDLYNQNIISNATNINEITSDSKLKFTTPPQTDIDLLSSTFAGGGKALYQDLINLANFYLEFGGFEGSVAGAVEYISEYIGYVLAMGYGKSSVEGFGELNQLYNSDEVLGVNFLTPIFQTVSGGQRGDLVTQFRKKIPNRYITPNSKGEFGSMILEILYVNCLRVGDSVQAILNSDPSGIGNTSYVMEIAKQIFPPSFSMDSRTSGISGAVYKLLISAKRFFDLTGSEINYPELNQYLAPLSGMLSDLADSFKSIGFKDKGFVPSLELTYYEPDKGRIRSRLLEIGFDSFEVTNILKAKTFNELIEQFTPLTDSQDVISFFRAFELTKLIYEFGGQEAIDKYVDYLYSSDSTASVINLLALLDKNRSRASVVSGSKYSKLIGYLITLTYAINPSELLKINEILVSNNLDLFESISFLVKNGVDNILKDPKDINLLGGVVAQTVINDNSGYEDQKPLWNNLIERSSGSVIDIEGLYQTTEGIIPEELKLFLNNPSPTSPLGQLIDGVRGGNLTSLLRYCNLFGLLYSISDYRNSSQLMNRPAEEYKEILELVGSLDRLSESMKLSSLILGGGKRQDSSDPLPVVFAQNKTMGAFIELLGGGDPSNSSILESPGVGNSRTPNGIRINNSLTPEEAELIRSRAQGLGVFTSTNSGAEDGAYVRFSISNILSNLGQVVGTNPPSPQETPTSSRTFTEFTDSYVPQPPSSPNPISLKPFDPAQSCLRFGGTNCEELGYGGESLCAKGYSKALFPETGYGAQSTSQSVPVDRPLGSKIEFTRSPNQIEKSSDQYAFTAQGLKRFGQIKSSEFLCASIEDPYEYSMCMSLLKCKNYRGNVRLKFCPSTLYGGKL